MRWTVHGERTIYDSAWVRLALVDVEIPGAERFEHHVVRSTGPAAGMVCVDERENVLLLWRHRFIPDTWGWEIPAGRVDPDEDIEAAARRETLEETGWSPGPSVPLVSWHPTIGLSDQRFHAFLAEGASQVGEPTDPGEAERIEWVPLDSVRRAMGAGEVHDGLTLTALAFALATGRIG